MTPFRAASTSAPYVCGSRLRGPDTCGSGEGPIKPAGELPLESHMALIAIAAVVFLFAVLNRLDFGRFD